MEKHLRGSAGVSRVEVNASGRVMRELNRTEGKSGQNIRLTIETNLQKFALERLKGMSGSSVLMEIDSGDILSLVSTPSYNPNNFVLGISQSRWDALLNDERKPLLNKATSGAYPPGSTFKMIVAAAALELGLSDLMIKYFVQGSMSWVVENFTAGKKVGMEKCLSKKLFRNHVMYIFMNLLVKLELKELERWQNSLVSVSHTNFR